MCICVCICVCIFTHNLDEQCRHLPKGILLGHPTTSWYCSDQDHPQGKKNKKKWSWRQKKSFDDSWDCSDQDHETHLQGSFFLKKKILQAKKKSLYDSWYCSEDHESDLQGQKKKWSWRQKKWSWRQKQKRKNDLNGQKKHEKNSGFFRKRDIEGEYINTEGKNRELRTKQVNPQWREKTNVQLSLSLSLSQGRSCLFVILGTTKEKNWEKN